MKNVPVHQQFSRKAQEDPEHMALERGEMQISYRELDQRAIRLARRLQVEGVEKEGPVAIYSADSCLTITAILGILKAGAAFVPLDPEMPPSRLRHMVGQVKPRLFLAEEASAAELEPLLSQAGPDPRVLTFEAVNAEDEAVNDFTEAEWEPDGMCYVYFTSGSTGEAKGIAGRLKGISHFIGWESETFSLGSDVRVSQLTLPSFDPFLRDCFAALCNGGTICVPDSRETVLDPKQLLAWLDKSKVQVIHCVPTLFRLMLQAKPSADQLTALKYIFLAGEVLPPEDCAAWFDIFGDRIELINLYGPSETTMTKFFHKVTRVDCSGKSIPIGQPMPGSRALLMDARMRPCPPKMVGEIYIRTPYRSLGYFNRPDLTEKVFIVNPFSKDPKDLIYKTGDYARMNDAGNYEFLGRMDNQIKIRGVRIEPMEIEAVLSEHPSVAEGVVAGRMVGAGKDATQQLVAYVVDAGSSLDVNQLRAFLEERLPKAMVPAIFITLDQLPRTIQGKVDRKALPTPKVSRETTNYVAPRTPVEEMVAAVWADVLHQPKVGIYDNFFALGGHSLLATQVVVRLRETFQVEMRLTKIFSMPTVEKLAAFIEQEKTGSGSLSAPRPVDRGQDLPLSHIQQQLWFMDRLAPGSSFYNLPTSIRLEGPLDLRVLEQCLNRMMLRHETLRTVYYCKQDGEPLQKVLPHQDRDLQIIDLSGLTDEQRDGAARAITSGAEQTSFDLAAEPPIRVVLLRENERRHVIQMTMHHIASDGWSMQVLFDETITLYKGLVKDALVEPPKLEIQYADYAHWQRQWLDDARVARELEYWREALAGAPEITGIPCDSSRPEKFTHQGRRVREIYPPELAASLKRLGRREDVTLFMTLAAGFLAVLRWNSGRDDLVIGTDFANRQHLTSERIVGCFVNQLPMRVQVQGMDRFKTLLGKTRDAFLGAYAHQELPFIKLVESLQPKRDASRGPLFQTKLVLQPPAIEEGEADALVSSPLETEHVTAQLDLILNLAETPEGLTASLEYCTDLYHEETIKRFLQHLKLVWERVCGEPEISLDEINALLEADVQAHQAAQRGREKQSEGDRLSKFKGRRRAQAT